jgi:uncharacterized membrane protein (DUF373 family)
VNKRQKSRFILWGRWFHRDDVVQSMEVFQDVIVMLLCISLFCTMAIQLWEMFSALLRPVDFKQVTADILFLLILVELFRLLIIYLEEHSISVGVAVEVSIVSVLREVIVHGALEITWQQILSICGLLVILGGLLMVCARTPHMDHLLHSQSYPFFSPLEGRKQEAHAGRSESARREGPPTRREGPPARREGAPDWAADSRYSSQYAEEQQWDETADSR